MSTETPSDASRPLPAQAEPVETPPGSPGRRGPTLDVEDAVPRNAAAASSTMGTVPSQAVVDREEFEALSNAVLEAASVASQAAIAASTAGRELKNTAGVLAGVTTALNKRSIWAMGILTGLLLLSIGFFSVMAVRMISKSNRLDATLMAVGKRVVELDAGLTGLRAIQENMDTLSERVETLSKAQAELGQRVDSSVQQSNAIVQQVPEKTAKQVATTNGDLTRQVQALSGRLQTQASATQSQAAAVNSLGEEVKALKGSIGEIAGVKRDVQALVTLQRERFLEILQKQGQTATDAGALRFPRPQTPRPGTPGAVSAGGSSGAGQSQ
jgi:hypothetical protein